VTDPAAHVRAWRWRILISTWLAYAGFYFCRKPFFVAKKTLMEDLGLSTGELGEIGTAYLLAYAIGQFVNAGIGQRRGARVVLLSGMALSIACNLAFAFANNYWTLLIFMFFNGLAQAAGWPTVVGTIGRWTRRAERGTIMGFWGTCYMLGGVAATSWAGFWLAARGTRGAFLAASSVLFVAWLVVWAWQRNRPEDVGLPAIEDPDDEPPTPDADTGHAVWTRPLLINLGLIGACYFGIKFIRYALWSWAPFLLESNFALAADEASYLSTLFDWAGLGGAFTVGYVSDKFLGGYRTLPALVMLVGMMGGCALLASLTLIGFMLYGPDSILSGAGAVDLGSPRMAVAVAGIINGMGSIGAVVQELLVSRLLESGSMGPVFGVLGAASVLSVTALSIMLVRNRRGAADL
jgi:OPA family glycerol-3-phosphate transporter-like MFS transporter